GAAWRRHAKAARRASRLTTSTPWPADHQHSVGGAAWRRHAKAARRASRLTTSTLWVGWHRHAKAPDWRRHPRRTPGSDHPPVVPAPGGPVETRREPFASRLRGKGVGRNRAAGDPRPAQKVSDEELVRALYAEHAAALLRFTLRMTDGDRQRAED